MPVCSVFIGSIHRSPKDIIIFWEGQFYDMLDNIVSQNKDYFILGDFNIDLTFKFFLFFHSQQLIKYPSRVTDDTRTLLDHIYADINCSFTKICVVLCG